MALNSLCCADVPLSNYSLTHSKNNDNRQSAMQKKDKKKLNAKRKKNAGKLNNKIRKQKE